MMRGRAFRKFARMAASCAFAAWFGLIPSPAWAESESAFYAALMKKETATVEDAVRLLARAQGYPGRSEMADELDYLHQRDIRFRQDILAVRQTPITAGNAAHLMLRATRLTGGVMAWVFPSNQRYALRQAAHLGLMPDDATVDDPLTGRDLLGFVSKLVQIISEKNK